MKATINITLKNGVLDPQGKAIENALGQLGFGGLNGVRQGKLIEIDLDESDADKARAARKYLEQTGELEPVLEHFGWELDLDQLVPFARWYPKNERIPRVYDTRFYLADIGTGAVEIEADLSENTHLFWTTAQGALDSAERGDIKVIFPTRRNLERLALFENFAAAKAQAEAIPVRTITPFIGEMDGKSWLHIGEDLGYPVTGEPLNTVARG